ncbi:MBL fold metallo-hydrolase [Candidatus Uhrbacteria bacterium]|nr:MBL fold metallo-hydrolase [Candidatus Uhrbacteria bacterium]
MIAKKIFARIAARSPILSGLIALLAVSGLMLFASGSFSSSGQMRVTFFDIGQGDAIHLRLPPNQDIIVDGGRSNRVVEKLGSAMPLFDRYIDIVVATHPDADHITGLAEVMRTYRVGMLLILAVDRDTSEYDELIAVARQYSIPIKTAQAGQIYQFVSGARFEILSSGGAQDAEDGTPLNDSSIVAMMKYQDIAILLTGDAGVAVEHEIVAHYPLLKAQILKVGHHGSRTSTSKAFLDAIKPEVAIISVGADNSYGHPHKEVMKNLKENDVAIYRTDMQGDITVTSDGAHYEITTQY